MNKPFEVCLPLVLLSSADAKAKAGIRQDIEAKASAAKGKGQRQTGIEDEVILASLSS
jgi:hypothetical protein